MYCLCAKHRTIALLITILFAFAPPMPPNPIQPTFVYLYTYVGHMGHMHSMHSHWTYIYTLCIFLLGIILGPGKQYILYMNILTHLTSLRV